MMLRDLTVAWLKANCPLPPMQQDLLQHLDAAIRSDSSCSFLIGPELTKSTTPFLISCFRGELFVFELTRQQAAQLTVNNSMLRCARGRTSQPHQRTDEPVIALEHIEIDQGDTVDRLSPITGTVAYQTSKTFLEPLTIRIVCEPLGSPSVTLFHHLRSLPFFEGSERFSMPPLSKLRDKEGTPFKGIVPLFFQIWTSNDRPLMPNLNSPNPSTVDVLKPKPLLPLGPGGWDPNRPPKTLMAQSASFPPPYDTKATTIPAAVHERPVSDVRALLVEIV